MITGTDHQYIASFTFLKQRSTPISDFPAKRSLYRQIIRSPATCIVRYILNIGTDYLGMEG